MRAPTVLEVLDVAPLLVLELLGACPRLKRMGIAHVRAIWICTIMANPLCAHDYEFEESLIFLDGVVQRRRSDKIIGLCLCLRSTGVYVFCTEFW